MNSMTNRSPENNSAVLFACLLFCLLAVLQSVVLAAYSLPCPRGDDSVYKSPAVELATHGRLRIPGMTGALNQANEGFAHYPPIYQLVFAGWYSLFGFSLRTTLLCSHLIHALSAAGIAVVSFFILRSDRTLSSTTVLWFAVGGGLFHLGNLSYFDRPEDLGIVFFCCLILVRETVTIRSLWSMLVCGLFVGLTGLTAPWLGVLAGLYVFFRELLERNGSILTRLARVAIAGFVSLVMVGGWVWSMEAGHPGIVHDQFIAGNLKYVNAERPATFPNRLRTFSLSILFDTPRAIALISIVLLPFRFPRVALSKLEISLLLISALGLLTLLILRPGAYTYLGATLVLLIPSLVATLAPFVVHQGRVSIPGLITVAACLGISQKDVIQSVSSIVRVPRELTANVCIEEIRDIIPSGDLVGVSPRHWYALQNRNPWRELFFVTTRHESEIINCQWIITYPGLGEPSFLSDYEMISEKASSFGPDETYAYTIWKRRD